MKIKKSRLKPGQPKDPPDNRRPHQPYTTHLVRCGRFVIIEADPGRIWLQKRGGEGMETTEEKLSKAISKFFDTEF